MYEELTEHINEGNVIAANLVDFGKVYDKVHTQGHISAKMLVKSSPPALMVGK